MTLIEAIILGIIQGLTEFLPVSSSGHLELAKALFGVEMDGKSGMLMTVVLHFATALATIVVFRKEVFAIFRGLLRFKNNEEFRFSMKIIISMIPAAFVGLYFDEILETLFEGQILLIGIFLILTSVLLFLANKAKSTNKEVSFLDSIIIGVAQAIAILPGISRSGATISTSVLLGVDREKSARFSFLMVVPLILGKVAKDMMSDEFTAASIHPNGLFVGFIAAFFTGILACLWMIAIVKRSKLSYFSIYCLVVGIVAIVWSLNSATV